MKKISSKIFSGLLLLATLLVASTSQAQPTANDYFRVATDGMGSYQIRLACVAESGKVTVNEVALNAALGEQSIGTIIGLMGTVWMGSITIEDFLDMMVAINPELLQASLAFAGECAGDGANIVEAVKNEEQGEAI